MSICIWLTVIHALLEVVESWLPTGYSRRFGLEAVSSKLVFSAVPDQGLLPPGCEIMSIDQNEWLISGSSNSLMHDTTVQLTQDARGAVYEALRSFPFRLIHAHHYVHIGLIS